MTRGGGRSRREGGWWRGEGRSAGASATGGWQWRGGQSAGGLAAAMSWEERRERREREDMAVDRVRSW